MTKPPGTRLPSSTLPRSNQSRDGALDPRAIDQNMRAIDQKLREIPQLRGDKPPEVDLIVGQEYQGGVLVGTMTAIVRNVGDNFDGFVRFAKVEGDAEFDHSDPTDTGVWNQTDSTLPYSASVNIQVKHGGLIAVAVPYRTFSDPDTVQWVIKQHRYDEDFDAELENSELTFDTDGYPLLALEGDEDVAKFYVTIEQGDDLAAATPADPTASVHDGELDAQHGKIRFDGTLGNSDKQTKMGTLVGYKVACENGDGIVYSRIYGPFFKRRGDSKSTKPVFHVIALRSGSTVTVTITASDQSLSLTALEFRRQNSGSSLDAAFGTGWSSSSGTIGTDESIVRAIDVTSAPGLAAKLSWRGTWTDEFGNSQFIGDEIDVGHLEQVSKTVKFPASIFKPASETESWNQAGAFLSAGTAGVAHESVGHFVFPVGVVLTGATMRAKRTDAASDNVSLAILRNDNSGITNATLATLTHSGTGYTSSAGSLSETVSTSYSYSGTLTMLGNALPTDAQFAEVEFGYDAPSYDKTY